MICPQVRKERKAEELALLERIIAGLESGKPARALGLTPEEVHIGQGAHAADHETGYLRG